MVDICLVADHQDGILKKTTLNALTFCRQVAEQRGGQVHLLLVGYQVASIVERLADFGAARIWVADDPSLEHYMAETWAHAVTEAVRKTGAGMVGMAAGTTGKDLIPRVAVKLGAGLASNVVGFDGRYFLRPVWAGSVLATVEVLTDIKAVTIQPAAFDTAEPVGSQTPVEELRMAIRPGKTRFIELRATVSERPDLTEARVIVSGGRGLDGTDNFALLEKLADLFGGAVGATRAAVDAGWAPNDLQIGQTGKIVSPELYVAVGLSGSTQHKAGIKNSQVIVAINKDEDAPIFEIADYGLVADLFEAVPALVDALRKEGGLSMEDYNPRRLKVNK